MEVFVGPWDLGGGAAQGGKDCVKVGRRFKSPSHSLSGLPGLGRLKAFPAGWTGTLGGCGAWPSTEAERKGGPR